MKRVKSIGVSLFKQRLYARQGCLSVVLCALQAFVEESRVRPCQQLLVIQEVSEFEAMIDGFEQMRSCLPQLWNVRRLVHEALRDRNVGYGPCVSWLNSFGVKVLLRSINPSAQFLRSLEEKCGATSRLDSRFVGAQIACLPVLPPRHRYRRENADDRKDSLNPRGLCRRLKDTPANPFAVHVLSPIHWSEA